MCSHQDIHELMNFSCQLPTLVKKQFQNWSGSIMFMKVIAAVRKPCVWQKKGKMTLIISPRLQKIYLKMPYLLVCHLYEKIVRNSDKICVSLLIQASPCHKELSRISIGPNNLKRGKLQEYLLRQWRKKQFFFCSILSHRNIV